MRLKGVSLLAVLVSGATSALFADSLKCDLAQYKASPGLTAAAERDLLVVAWTGQGGASLRARYAIENGSPVIRDLFAGKAGGAWAVLGQNLSPEYHVTSGLRRMTEQQAQPLRQLGIPITPV